MLDTAVNTFMEKCCNRNISTVIIIPLVSGNKGEQGSRNGFVPSVPVVLSNQQQLLE